MNKLIGDDGTNIEFNEFYDQESDIYYVSFKTGEPSHVVEIDDTFLVEVGFFSSLPTGFRVLNYSKLKGFRIKFDMQKIKEAIEGKRKEGLDHAKLQSEQFENALKKVLTP